MKNTNSVYDTIGLDYANLRKPDPRISKMIHNALGNAKSVLNVGAGAGSYEPQDRQVTAIEPSIEMIRQRVPSSTVSLQGHAENLPFEENSFDASMATLTIHHWSDREKGVREMRRVTQGVLVFLTHDPEFKDLWILDYFPEFRTMDDGKMPKMQDFERWLGPVEILPVPVPADCTDGFLAAYWKRPAAYLDDKVRASTSPFWGLGDITDRLQQLQVDIANGTWARRNSNLIDLDELDCGYRLVIARTKE